MPSKPSRPTVTKVIPPLELTAEQIEFIKPLLELERPAGGFPKVIVAQVRSAPYPNKGKVHIAFALVDFPTGNEILGLIERSRETRYAPGASFSNYVEILPQGEPVFVIKDRRKKGKATSPEMEEMEREAEERKKL